MCEPGGDFSTAPPPARLRPEASGAVGKSFVMLHGAACEAIAVGDRKRVHRLAPLFGCATPVGGDVAQREVPQLDEKLYFEGFAQPAAAPR